MSNENLQSGSLPFSKRREIIKEWQKIKSSIPEPLHQLIRYCIIKDVVFMECYTKGSLSGPHFIDTFRENNPLRFDTAVIFTKTDNPQLLKLISMAKNFPEDFDVREVSYGSKLEGYLLGWSSTMTAEKIPDIIEWLKS